MQPARVTGARRLYLNLTPDASSLSNKGTWPPGEAVNSFKSESQWVRRGPSGSRAVLKTQRQLGEGQQHGERLCRARRQSDAGSQARFLAETVPAAVVIMAVLTAAGVPALG